MGTSIEISIDEHQLREIILKHLTDLLNCDIKPTDIKIEMKANNRTSEWEKAHFRATAWIIHRG